MTAAIDLKPAQIGLLAGVCSAPREGYNAAELDPAMMALARRGLVEWRGARGTPRILRWHATADGRDLIQADRERRGIADRRKAGGRR